MVKAYKLENARIGYGQVEPNHLSAQKTGQIYAQLPAMTITTDAETGAEVQTPIAQLEQGQFLKYNYPKGCAAVVGDGEWMLVYCEEKLYDERKPHHKDFALKASDFTDGKIYPRLLKVNVGDIYTTNTFGGNAASDVAKTNFGLTNALVTQAGAIDNTKLGVKLTINANGFLTDAAPAQSYDGPEFVIAKIYTMPDGQTGVKVQRVK